MDRRDDDGLTASSAAAVNPHATSPRVKTAAPEVGARVSHEAPLTLSQLTNNALPLTISVSPA